MKQLRTWPALLLIALIVVLRLIPTDIDNGPDNLWMVSAFGPLVGCLLVLIWWLAGSRASVKEKLLGLAGIVLGVILTATGIHSTMKGPGMITLTVPMGIGGFAAAAVCLSRRLSAARILVILVVCFLSLGFSLLLRNEGMWGDGKQEFRWRWTQTAEQQFLAEKDTHPEVASSNASEAASWKMTVTPEWPGFRGIHRDGRQSETITYTSDWSKSPPQELWRISVGPGWSSFAVARDRIFTQEQRGADEVIVCYEADTGSEIWTSPAGGRFDDPMGGPGPRATPQLSGGKVFGLTAEGNLVCVDASDGKLIWKKNIAKIAERSPPMWGFSSSPLVIDSLVIVHAGGKGDRGTLAFDTETGELKWSAPAGDHSYSSPHYASLLGSHYVLMSTNQGLRILDPQSGEVRYFHDSAYNGYRCLQPQRLGQESILVQASGGPGTFRLQLSQLGDQIKGEEIWNSTWLKSDFNDCVVHKGYLYGFNGSVLVCLDIETGERKWRGGRYGKGQMLLLEHADLILVMSERGRAALIRTSPDAHEELAFMSVFEGKSWSHPVVVGDRLFVRNDREAACYVLPVERAITTKAR